MNNGNLLRERGAFVACLSQEIDGTLRDHKRRMYLDWGCYYPTGRRYYEGPQLNSQNASKCESIGKKR